jgi:hypothetical protein
MLNILQFIFLYYKLQLCFICHVHIKIHMKIYALRHIFYIHFKREKIINPTKVTHVETFENKVQILVIQKFITIFWLKLL